MPDEEALAFLFLPLLVLALHRGLRSDRRAWLGVAGVFLLAFPLTHTFSTLVAGTTLVAWLAAARSRLTPTQLVGATAFVGAFWGYFAGYYELTGRLGFVVPYVGRVTAHPGLFVAWLLAMVFGIWWFRGANHRGRIAVILAPVLVWVGVVLVNAVQPVFPGTVASPGVLPYLLGLYLVPAIIGSMAASRLATAHEGSVILLALLAAPVALVGFSLTAALTPEFFGTVMRTQTFAHLPFVGLASLAVADAVTTGKNRATGKLAPGLAALLIVTLAITAPVAYVDLDTLAFPSTTTESEFQAASFAAEHVVGPWTSDHVLTRIASHYYGRFPAIGPTAGWLGGGPPPDCVLLSAISWTSSGAHLFPAGPRTVTRAEYHRTLAGRHLVYASRGGYDSFVLSLPTKSPTSC